MSTQQPVEIILARQLASYLTVPIFLVDLEGTLLYYNAPAGEILGLRFEKTGRMPLEEWGQAFRPTDEEGDPLQPEELPLAAALEGGRPVHGSMRIEGMDGISRRIHVTGIPLEDQAKRRLGALAIFWETPVPGTGP
ncbi:MAG: PAS domain-containing protein [Gemmatimonadota bacterium]|nr:PAS domain-containing protein [Gemmatimonadota bacterium]